MPPLKLADPFEDVMFTEILIALLPLWLTPLTVISPVLNIALLMVTPLPAVANATRLLVEVLMKPDTGVQAGVEAVHPYVLSSST